MLNILSVDIDWIMEPSINFYNNQVSDQDDFLAKNDERIIIPADLKKYAMITKLIFSLLPSLQLKDIFIAEGHEEIFKAISKWQLNDKFKIYNIDHHHDCGYLYDNISLHNLINECNCANWVPYVYKKFSTFVKYIWIGNKNSFPLDSQLKSILPDYNIYDNLEILDNIKIDKIFICKSRAWIPVEYRELIDSFTYSIIKVLEMRK